EAILDDDALDALGFALMVGLGAFEDLEEAVAGRALRAREHLMKGEGDDLGVEMRSIVKIDVFSEAKAKASSVVEGLGELTRERRDEVPFVIVIEQPIEDETDGLKAQRVVSDMRIERADGRSDRPFKRPTCARGRITSADIAGEGGLCRDA